MLVVFLVGTARHHKFFSAGDFTDHGLLPYLFFRPTTIGFKNKAKRMIRFLLNALNTDGSALVSGRLQLRSIIPPNAEPLGDITTDGGFSALTGNQIWVLSSILPLLFRPIFANHTSMVSK